MQRRYPYVLGVLIGLDQFGNTLMGGNPDETISSRVGRHAIEGKRWALVCEFAINGLFRILAGSHDHCRSSVEWDELTAEEKSSISQSVREAWEAAAATN